MIRTITKVIRFGIVAQRVDLSLSQIRRKKDIDFVRCLKFSCRSWDTSSRS